LQVTDWDDAIAAAARITRERRVVVLASPNLSNEALFLLERVIAVGNGQGVFRLSRGDAFALPGVPDLALREERAANATGARALGFAEVASPEAALRDGDVLLVVGDTLEDVAPSAIARASAIVTIGTALPALLASRSAVVLPVTNTLEEEGTFTNLRGRVQRFLQAKTAPGIARPTWYVLADLLAAMGGEGRFFLPQEVFAALAATHAPFAGLDYEALGLRGLPVVDASASPTVSEVTA
jgi:NADH-quinone oxidoreductase subunit G